MSERLTAAAAERDHEVIRMTFPLKGHTYDLTERDNVTTPDLPRPRFVMVDAAMARGWIATIGTQRAQRPMYARHLADAMVRDEWRPSNDAIAFVGKLRTPGCRQVNGQHRSLAVIIADEEVPGITVPMLVVDGYGPDAAATFDVGRMRTLADTLDMLDGPTEAPGHRDLAAVANLAWHVERGSWANRVPAPTRVQLVDYAKSQPALLDAVPLARTLNYGMGGGIAGYAVAVWLAAAGSHLAELENFVEAAGSGEMLTRGNPAYTLREVTVRHAREMRAAGGERSVRSWWLAAVTVLAWNDYVAGVQRTKRYDLRRGDVFPVAL